MIAENDDLSGARAAILLGVLMLTGAALRIGPIVERPLWYDESITWHTAARDWRAHLIWRHHPEHPPLSFMTVKSAVLLAGSEREWVLRTPSVVAGVLCIPAVFALGAVLGTRRLGLAAALLATVDLNMVAQSQTARMYAQFVLLELLSLTGLALLLCRRRQSLLGWAMVGVGFAMMYWTHYLSLVVIVAVLAGFAWWLWQYRSRCDATDRIQTAIGAAFAFSIAGLLSFYGIIHLISRIGGGGFGNAPAPSFAQIAMEVVRNVDRLVELKAVGCLMVIVAIVGLTCLPTRVRAMSMIMMVLVAANLIMTAIGRLDHHTMAPRYFSAMQPSIWIGVSTFVLALRTGLVSRIGIGAFAVLIIWCAALSVQHSFGERPNRYIAGTSFRYVSNHIEQSAVVYFLTPRLLVTAEYYRLLPRPNQTYAVYGGDLWTLDAAAVENMNIRRAWLIVGRVSRQADQDRVLTIAQMFAARLNVPFDRNALGLDFDSDWWFVLRIDQQGVTISTYRDLVRAEKITAFPLQ